MKDRILREMEQGIQRHTDPEVGRWLKQFSCDKSVGNFPFGELAVKHYFLLGGESEEIYCAAAAVELLILSLDIFDDLQDKDNPTTLWSQLDPAVAMNLAIACLSLSQMLFTRLQFPEEYKKILLPYVNEMVLRSVSGQQKDILNQSIGEKDYLEMVEDKSGSLMALACLTGAILSGQRDLYEDIRIIGQWFGLVAQLQNDMRDAMRWDLKNDLLRKKKTLPILYLLNKEQEEYRIFTDYYEGSMGRDELLSRKIECIELMKKSGVIEYISVFIQLYLIKIEEKIDRMHFALQEKDRLKEIFSL